QRPTPKEDGEQKVSWIFTHKRKLAVSSAMAIALIGAASAAHADGIADMEAQIDQMQEQIKQLRREVDAKKKDDTDLKVKWRGAPELSSKDGNFKMKVRGRIHTDYNAINQDRGITGSPSVSAIGLRRARLGVQGTVWGDVD